jgi:predicted aldo/keto reductase-like oxidoreductase
MRRDRLNSRREFLRSLALGGLAAVSSLPSPAQEWRRKKGEIWYRRLGRTGLFVSEISLGSSPLPDWALFREIVERGVNYIDTSSSYSNGNSERQIGRLLKEAGRDKVSVCTKFHLRGGWDEESILRSVEGSLLRLGTDHVEVLAIHGATSPEDLVDERVAGAFERLKTEGKCLWSGLSCHSNHERVVRAAVDSGRYDVIQLGYNIFDIEEPSGEVETYDDYLGASRTRDLIRYAAGRGVGTIAMKTLKVGGQRQNLERYRTADGSLFQAMLKWALEEKAVSSVVTEMLNRRQMEEDLAAAGEPLTADERTALFRHVAENGKDYCRYCGRCQAGCPSGIATTDILRYLAYHESYGKTSAARAHYSELDPEMTAPACRDCGRCESRCRFGVRVRGRIRQAHQILGG